MVLTAAQTAASFENPAQMGIPHADTVIQGCNPNHIPAAQLALGLDPDGPLILLLSALSKPNMSA